ncbi:ester cyclase [Halorarum salinum]|uniref:Ester cyclase n=1 Tax=Halorarum salinum TaxID=2743089 RepID=A0A7D5QIF2_9EURY|nr:ester cyclase [Halobaculum salinum]QLG60665.1 ester cyclase [Halobaculum salinum]
MTTAKDDATRADDNERVVRRLNEEVWEKGNFDVIDELVADDYVLHDSSMPEPVRGPDGYREMAEMGAGVVDGRIEAEQVISTGDWVVTRWTMRGTHTGEMAGVEPTNEEVTMTGIDISRVEDGELAESWQEVNMLPMLMQIGAVPDDLFAEEMPADD